MKGVYTTADEAVKCIESGNRVFIQGSAATPLVLAEALLRRREELKDVELMSISMLGDLDLSDGFACGAFRMNSLFVSANIRKAVNEGYGDYIPVFLSEIPELFNRNILPLDVAMIHVSPPDTHGFCSLGVSVDVAKSAVKNAKKIIAQINPLMPRTHGDGMIKVSEIDYLVETEQALPEVDYRKEIGECERKISRYCAELIEDGATLQMGIGTIPDAVLECLTGHKNLGIHTEMFSNGVMPLLKSGVINNALKRKHRGKVATTFAVGNRELYDYLDDNPEFVFLEAGYVNDGKVIRANPKVVAINSAIEMDITGQVCADSIGTYQFSGVGGQMDFIRGAALSHGGKPIIAMSSVTGKGISKIVPTLKTGAGVVTTRAHMHYVITEYGVVNLFGLNLRQRAKALIRIAHPDHQEILDKAAFERFGPRYYTLR
ncbi:MAG: 4-hydroxybutyrate CoA-transferase [Flavobacteriales bacterium]|nr:4-hydroxybutyrate CoA-transferase [Flavobacteriales bacterium]